MDINLSHHFTQITLLLEEVRDAIKPNGHALTPKAARGVLGDAMKVDRLADEIMAIAQSSGAGMGATVQTEALSLKREVGLFTIPLTIRGVSDKDVIVIGHVLGERGNRPLVSFGFDGHTYELLAYERGSRRLHAPPRRIGFTGQPDDGVYMDITGAELMDQLTRHRASAESLPRPRGTRRSP